MRVNKKYICLICSIVAFLIALYTGITFIATLTKAITQPHLESSTVRFDFLGFYMLSSTYGGITLAVLALAIILLILMKKFGNKQE